MLSSLLLHGALFVAFTGAYSRWHDEELLAELCLFALATELVVAVLAAGYLDVTDSVFTLDLGALQTTLPLLTVSLLLCFDEVGGVFLGILTFALLVCFSFLAEYFEYDAHASSIIFLSALFSQVALLYFCAFDVFLILFLWEVIGFVSFLLVQHWAHRVSTYKAGLKVFAYSQCGDVFLLLGFFVVFGRAHTSSLAELAGLFGLLAGEYLLAGPVLVGFGTLVALLVGTAGLLKAAQFVFYPWLLDAMEAPVPISAQLHSSTLVVVGFYLFFRLDFVFTASPAAAAAFTVCGLATAVGGAVLAFFQEDGKRLLACSTASQLGYVVVALGLGLPGEAALLLAFCCCNKAFTFVWFGVLMQHFSGLSDFRLIRGVSRLSWLVHAGLAVSVANFTVLPGVFSWHVKGLFLRGVLAGTWLDSLAVNLLQLTWFFSSLYLLRLYYSLFLKPTAAAWWGGAERPAAPRGAAPLHPRGQSTRALVLSLAFYGALLWAGGSALFMYTDVGWLLGGVAGAVGYF